ncbi:MAG TPA: hypothetical protein VGO80_11250 [Solirubrobacteraceae bacterium]|nr:hypothetical protein [Solirubrobacteraceae bacterium]
MRDGGRQYEQGPRTPVERIVGRDLDESSGKGRPLSERARQSRRSVESYLKGGVRPRWMERVGDIDAGIARERRLLAEAHERLRAACARDGTSFSERWHALALSWPFPDELTALIEQHNEWYPIERDLPINPRTGDYVRVGGRWYGRPTLGPAWVLEQFPAGA